MSMTHRASAATARARHAWIREIGADDQGVAFWKIRRLLHRSTVGRPACHADLLFRFAAICADNPALPAVVKKLHGGHHNKAVPEKSGTAPLEDQ